VKTKPRKYTCGFGSETPCEQAAGPFGLQYSRLPWGLHWHYCPKKEERKKLLKNARAGSRRTRHDLTDEKSTEYARRGRCSGVCKASRLHTPHSKARLKP
ncbi:hypothetical protein DQ04_04381050, partial [Trypanosoma grayi]|uniref:hypothetical protein n=1 Tax=Trypanosoma grayi TaxID=71804 RepID=UPI0004F42848